MPELLALSWFPNSLNGVLQVLFEHSKIPSPLLGKKGKFGRKAFNSLFFRVFG
jgi:hypothetical protein